MATISISDKTCDELLASPCGPAALSFVLQMGEAYKASSEIARANGVRVPECASTTAFFAVQYVAWMMMSAARLGSADFDPVQFGRDAERIARETVPLYAQEIEKRGASVQ